MNLKQAVSSVFAAAALGLGLAQAPAHAAASPAPKYVVLTCTGKAVTAPATWTPYCADEGVILSGMRWSSWNAHLASGYGTVSENDDFPDAAQGRIYRVPVLVTLWGSALARHHPGEDTYTQMTLIFPGPRPAVYRLVNGKWTATYPPAQTLGF